MRLIFTKPVTYTSDVLEHKWQASLKHYTINKWLILTSNTQATQKKVECLNYAYTVKGMQCRHNNHGHNYVWTENNNNNNKKQK